VRRRHQLAAEPLCAECIKRNKVTPATVADHVTPHKGNWNESASASCKAYASRATTEREAWNIAAISMTSAPMASGSILGIPSIRSGKIGRHG
jgi:hypothetical protein